MRFSLVARGGSGGRKQWRWQPQLSVSFLGHLHFRHLWSLCAAFSRLHKNLSFRRFLGSSTHELRPRDCPGQTPALDTSVCPVAGISGVAAPPLHPPPPPLHAVGEYEQRARGCVPRSRPLMPDTAPAVTSPARQVAPPSLFRVSVGASAVGFPKALRSTAERPMPAGRSPLRRPAHAGFFCRPS